MGRENKDCLGGVLLRRLADQDKQLCLFFTPPLAVNEKKLPPLTNIFHNSVNCIFVYLFIQNQNDQILKRANTVNEIPIQLKRLKIFITSIEVI